MPEAAVAFSRKDAVWKPSVEDVLGSAEVDTEGRSVFRIGELADEFGVSLRTLRFYEDRGLLNPAKRKTTRFYSRQDRRRLRLILLAKALGFSLIEAKQLIAIYETACMDDAARSEAVLRTLIEQKAHLLAEKAGLDRSIGAIDQSTAFLRSRLGL